jgi:hypothetical protein
MIFGFNTDIAAAGTVYHVQTEVREQEPRLESQVFVRGRCIGKRAVVLPPDATEEEIQELARAQHRWVVEAVRGGFVDDALNETASNEHGSKPNALDASNREQAEELVVELMGSQRVSAEHVVLRFRILSGGYVAGKAEVAARWKIESISGELETVFTNDAGVAEMRFALAEGPAELEVKARLEGRETTRRFRIKSAKT